MRGRPTTAQGRAWLRTVNDRKAWREDLAICYCKVHLAQDVANKEGQQARRGVKQHCQARRKRCEEKGRLFVGNVDSAKGRSIR